jgi:lysophospholipase L1-like esterase
MRRRGLAGIAAVVIISASLLTPSAAWASANASGNTDRNVDAASAGTTNSRAAKSAASERNEMTEAGRMRGAVQGLPYVALGDSYAAGFGVGPASGAPVPGCDQSAADYPHLVAQQLGLRLTDVSCAGAVTANVISTSQLTGDGTAPPQISGLGASTRIVTVTIGGNDLGFDSIASSCVALSSTGPVIADPQFTNCKALYETRGADSLVSRLDGPVLYGSPGAPNGLTATFAAIRKAAPHAKVFVVGYPAIAPDASNTPAAGCFRPAAQPDAKPPYPQNSFPFTNTDVSYLNFIERLLDKATRRAAKHDGFTYISLLSATEAHSACAAVDDAYVNGITVDSISRSLQVSVSPGALHPNADGIAFISNTVKSAILKAFEPPAKHGGGRASNHAGARGRGPGATDSGTANSGAANSDDSGFVFFGVRMDRDVVAAAAVLVVVAILCGLSLAWMLRIRRRSDQRRL